MNPERWVINLPHRTDRLEAFHQRWGPVQVMYGYTAKPPQYGCLQAHRTLWTVLERDALVLEDDAMPVRELRIPTPPSDWDLLYLGGQHVRPPQRISEDLVRCVATQRTHAYVIRHASISRLLPVVSGLSPSTHISHALAGAMLDGAISAYAVTPWQVGQDAGYSDIAGGVLPAKTWDRGVR